MKAISGCLIGLVFGVCVSAEPLLEGQVRLDSGEPVADVQVRLFDMTDLRQGAIARAMTDGTGYFALPLAALTGRALPARFALGPNYPNPFNPSTIIPYQLAVSSQVRLEVFNLLGQRIATLVDGARPAGFHTATWTATDGAGRAVAAGVYIYRMTVGQQSQTGRMVLIDGQAGRPAVGSGGSAAAVEAAGEAVPVYGLTVSGPGLVSYVNPAFRVAADRGSVDLVVETLDSIPRATGAATGILGEWITMPKSISSTRCWWLCTAGMPPSSCPTTARSRWGMSTPTVRLIGPTLGSSARMATIRPIRPCRRASANG